MAKQMTRQSPSLARWFGRVFVWPFALLYLAALFMLAIGALGWFGRGPAPLSGVYLIVLGLPWTLAAAWFPDRVQPAIAALAPCVSLIILWILSHWPRRKQPR